MLFPFRKKESNGTEPVDWAGELQRCEQRREFFLLCSRALMQCMREFALESSELDGAGFKQSLAHLAEVLGSSETVRRLQPEFERGATMVGGFARRQKEYVRDRETEFKGIIDVLTKAVVVQDSENREYNRSILEQSRRLEEISLLDDIKRVKLALVREVDHLREAVREKEARDGAKIDSLSQQVNVLKVELQSVRAESERDGLTGIFNRRTFDRYLSDLTARNLLEAQEVALLMVDIDDFKRVNDRHGHLTGDSVLVAIVNKCRQCTRAEDVLARYGGEEFCILLPGISLRNAVKKGRHICESIASTRYVLEGVPTHEPLGITVSIGVSVLRKGETAAALIDRADRALYAAKTSGKNRAVSEKDAKQVR
jgi:diguanylate cyclase